APRPWGPFQPRDHPAHEPTSSLGRPREAASGPRGLSASDPGGLHAAELVLEVLDLVPDPGGDLELQLRGGRVLLLGELTDRRDRVSAALAARRRAPAGRLVGGLPGPRGEPGHRRLAAALLPSAPAEQLLGVGVFPDELVEDVRDALAQRRGVDPVLAV